MKNQNLFDRKRVIKGYIEPDGTVNKPKAMNKTQKIKYDNIVIAILFALTITGAFMCSSKPIERYYEVEVRVKLGTCSTIKKVVVKATSSYQAKENAIEEIEASLETSIKGYKEIRR